MSLELFKKNCSFCREEYDEENFTECLECGEGVCPSCLDNNNFGEPVCPSCYEDDDDNYG